MIIKKFLSLIEGNKLRNWNSNTISKKNTEESSTESRRNFLPDRLRILKVDIVLMIPKTAATIPTPGKASAIIATALIERWASASRLCNSAVKIPPISAGLHRPSTIGRKELQRNSTKPLSFKKEGYFVKIELFLRIADMLVQRRGTLPPSKHEQLVKQD